MSIFDPITPEADEVPAYLRGADLHNIGNTGQSWFDPSTWGDRLSNGFKFAATAVASGVAQLANSGVAIGKLAGASLEEVDTESMVAAIDSNLGEYYSNNRDSVDLGGFLVSSLVPGIAGVKVFNAGQKALVAASKGNVGANMSRATGLLVPQTERYIAAAAQEINASQATFSAISQSGIKALASGVHQNVLESIAFEVAVQATMFKSPVLSNQDAGDVAFNIALGGVVGGVIGGAFTGASTYGAIKKSALGFERANKSDSARFGIQEMNDPALNVIRRNIDLDEATKITPLPAGATADEIALYTKRMKDVEDRNIRHTLEIRSNINALAKGENLETSNLLADIQVGTSAKDTLDWALHAKQIGRAGETLAVEKEANRLTKEAIDKGLIADTSHLQLSHIKLTGEGAGEVFQEVPNVLRIADTVALRKNQSIESAVREEVSGYKFKVGTMWDASKLAGKTGHFEAEARQIWADHVLEALPKIGDFWVHKGDIPLIQRAWREGRLDVRLVDDTGQALKSGFSSRDELWNYLKALKTEVAGGFLEKIQAKLPAYLEMNAEMAAKIADTKFSRLSGTLGDESLDYQANLAAGKALAELKKAKGLIRDPNVEELPIAFTPSYAKVGKVIPENFLTENGGHVLDALAWIKTQERAYQTSIDNVAAKNLGDLADNLYEIPEKALLDANKFGGSASMFAYSNGGYGTLGSIMQSMGAVTQKVKQAFRKETGDTFTGVLTNLGKNQDAVIEFNSVNQLVTRSGKLWVRHEEEGTQYLITTEAKKALREGAADGTRVGDIAELGMIEIKNSEVAQVVDAMISRSSKRTTAYKELRAAQGKTDHKDPDIYRPLRPDTKDYKHFAFVKDDRVTGAGHTTMIFAATPEKLAELATKTEQAGFRVQFKSASEDWHKAMGDYEYSRTLHESYIDSELKNKGIFSEHYTRTDPQKTINSILQQHTREDDVLAMELVRAKNKKAFDYLEDQGKAYSKIEGSKFGGSVRELETSGNNPYLDYIKTALDISKSQHNIIYDMNKTLDSAVSKVVASIREMKVGTYFDAEAVNASLQRHGVDTAYRTAADELLINHSVPKGELTKFVRGANAVLSKLTLGLDPLNALNNAIGANVLRGTELKQITDAIKGGNSELAGELSKLMKVTLPGVKDEITAPSKLVAKAIKNFWQDGKGGPLHLRYQEAGYIKDMTTQFHDLIDDFTLRGTESVQDLNTRWNRATAKAEALSLKGEKLTQNALAEEFNRFISADVMRQITDLAETSGILSRAESHTYINTFVNRVEGNTIASQRPLVFQGPVGQAIGLFQSYQFNMIQQLFRYVAEGTKKDAAMLLGLQGTFYGLNGMPGFQFFNQHVIGSMSGNPQHRDAYDALYAGAGKQMGDLLMYGLPSNLLQANLYSRGDINPRHVTILPTSLPDIPFVGAFGKFLGNVKETAGKISGGGNVWESMLQGLEHNGISRPLAGIAQTLQAGGPGGQAYSTTNKGSILFSNDLVSWATAVRIAGGRPLDEAIINDGVFRINSYQQADRKKQQSLAETIKTTTIQGNTADEEQVVKFAKAYAEAGGKQINFNKFMMSQLKASNTNEASKITSALQNPFARKVQVLMGGTSPDEF